MTADSRSLVRFGDLYADPSRNGIYKGAEWHGRGARIVNMGEVFSYDRIGAQEMERIEVTDNEFGRFGLKSGDLLFARRSLIESGAGRCVLVAELLEPTVFESSIIRVRVDAARCDPAFYLYYFRAGPGRAAVAAIVNGVAQKGIRGSELENIQVASPSIALQRRIAATLGAYDDLIDVNDRRVRLLEESVRLLYGEWFERLRFPGHGRVTVVDGVPRGWARVRLDEAVDLNPKTRVPSDRPRPFVPMNALSTSSMLIEEWEERTGAGGAKFMNSDTLLARITPCLENGKTAFVQFLEDESSTAAGSTEFIVMRGKLIGPCAVYCLARSPAFRNHAIRSMVGSDGRQRVQTAALAGYTLAIPDEATAAAFEGLADPVFRQIHALNQQSRAAARARDLLLPRLMDGTLTPPDDLVLDPLAK